MISVYGIIFSGRYIHWTPSATTVTKWDGSTGQWVPWARFESGWRVAAFDVKNRRVALTPGYTPGDGERQVQIWRLGSAGDVDVVLIATISDDFAPVEDY